MKHRVMTLAAISLVAVASGLSAHEPSVASQAGLRGEILAEIDAVEKKLLALAGAVPPEKFGWRPGEGVRSVSEVYMHVAGGNYMIPTFIGIKPPEGIDRGMEKSVTEKGKVVAALKQSFDHLRKAVRDTPDADWDSKVKLFGRIDSSKRGVFLLLLNHAHEHLGQSIAYARSNGVAPPWSEGPEPPKPAAKPGS
ncbi:MAG: DinB family protein [Thermoanaerobaculia bacterium]|nr:DinB family protein [Thermoanaerobaculia bacterium]